MDKQDLILSNDSLLNVEMSDMKSTPAKVSNLNFYELITDLHNEQEAEFLIGLNSIAGSSPSQLPGLFQAADENNSLLTLACAKGLINAVETMLRLGADINAAIDTARGPLTPVESACHFGNWKVLEILLKSPKLDLSKSGPLLSIVVKNIGEKDTPKCNYEKCFQMLINHKDIDVNQLDGYECSALHYAVKFNNTDAILELMKRGAYLGQKNAYNQFPLTNINPEVLERHLDSCISTNEFRPGEDDFEIQFDYSSLVPYLSGKQNVNKSSNKPTKSDDLSPNEMISIEIISETNELRHLIRHPLIASFLFLKWNQLALIFYLNFICCLLFAVSTTTFASIYEQFPEPTGIKNIMRVVSFVLTLYMIAREMSQFRLSPLTYFRSVENYMECAMIGLVIIILFDLCDEDWRRTIVATVVLLIGIEVFHLAGSLPFWSFSTHYVMLKTVVSSFLKSLTLYVILLLSFSLAFFTLLREKPIWLRDSFEGENNFNKFSNLGISIIKTLVMSTGEFDAADIHFDTNPWSYFIFITFLFIITTALLNLLNGLAVNDIQTIKSEAELTNFIHRCQVLARYERALLNNKHSCSLPIFMKYFARDAISVLKKLKPNNKIGVKTNAYNQISIPNVDTNSEPMLCNSCFSYFGRCSRMSDKIVKMAYGVLRKMNAQKFRKITKDPLRDEIQELKASIELIKQMILDKEIKS